MILIPVYFIKQILKQRHVIIYSLTIIIFHPLQIKKFLNVKSFSCKCQKAFVNPTSFIDHDCDETHEHEALDNHEHGRDSGDDSGVDDDEANAVSVNGIGNDKKPLKTLLKQLPC